MQPYHFFVLALVITATTMAVQLRSRRRHITQLQHIGQSAGMQFFPRDQFALAPRVARYFPTPGIADVRVFDLLYRSGDSGQLCYVFTVEYTTGVFQTKRRLRRIVRMDEPKSTTARHVPPTLAIADHDGSLLSQYERLLA